MSYKINALPLTHMLGEGPHWDGETQSLYYVDIRKPSIHRLSYDENKVYSATLDGEQKISFIIPVEDEKDRFAVGLGKRVAVIHWDGKSDTAKVERIVFEVETADEVQYNSLNDGKADPQGRLYVGSFNSKYMLNSKTGALYSFMKNEGLQKWRSNITLSNGLAWNEKSKKMYFIDSGEATVREFNYNQQTGAIDDGRVLIDLKGTQDNPNASPDGMTIDSQGFLYVAIFGGSKVCKIDPSNGKIVLSINLPCKQITSVAFGGPKLDILYVTSANLKDEPTKPVPEGATFVVTGLGAVGLTMNKVKL